MLGRTGDNVVALDGMVDDVVADMADERAGALVGLFFAAFLGSDETAEVEVVE